MIKVKILNVLFVDLSSNNALQLLTGFSFYHFYIILVKLHSK